MTTVHRVELPGGAALRITGPSPRGLFALSLHVGDRALVAHELTVADVGHIRDAAGDAADLDGEDLGPLVVWDVTEAGRQALLDADATDEDLTDPDQGADL